MRVCAFLQRNGVVLAVGAASMATAAAGASSPAIATAPALPLRTVARVALPGPSVRFDYMSLDPNADRLYIAHMNAGQLLVFDIHRRRIVKTIPAPGVHGVIAVPAQGRVYASATDAHQLFTIIGKTGSIIARAPAGDYPDGLVYDSVERHVFVSDEAGGAETVFNARGRRIATIRLDGEAGNVQYDSASGRVFVDVQTRNEIAVIDPRSNRVVRRVPLQDCFYPHGLLVDSTRRLAFVACVRNATLLTLDLRTMHVTDRASIGLAADVLALDSSLHRLYVAAETGVVSVFAEHAHGVTKLGQALLASRAHTVAVDPRTHLVYFPLEMGVSGRPELLITTPTRR